MHLIFIFKSDGAKRGNPQKKDNEAAHPQYLNDAVRSSSWRGKKAKIPSYHWQRTLGIRPIVDRYGGITGAAGASEALLEDKPLAWDVHVA